MKWHMVAAIALVGSGLFLLTTRWSDSSGLQPSVSSYAPEQSVPSADVQVRNMHLIERAGATNAWLISAQQATINEAGVRASVRQIHAQLAQGPAEVLYLSARRGELLSATGDMAVEGDVRLWQQHGVQIETEHLRWYAADHLLHTDAPVTLRTSSAAVVGKGLRIPVDSHSMIVERDVRASFRLSEALKE